MKILFIREYPLIDKETKERRFDKHGNPITMYRYAVTGDKSELDKYDEIAQREGYNNIDENTGGHVWSTPRAVPRVTTKRAGELLISTNDKLYPNTSAVNMAASMLEQYPGKLGEMLAKEILDLKTFDQAPVTTESPEDVDKLD